ncbi:MAG TPA: hypothetical protein VML94_08265 [Thermoplasmata archaeon]|nr:hypothetical protein [Thermoplasmata archaeon]
MSSPAGNGELFPGGFRKPTSILISGGSRSLLKWFAYAALAPYSARVYWTDVRFPGEILDPLDPMAAGAVDKDSLYVLTPRELEPDDQSADRAQSAAAALIRSDEAPGSLQGLVEFLRMPSHAQKLISTTTGDRLPSILVTANSQRLATVYSLERIAPLMRALLDAGTCQVALWAEAPTTAISVFEVILHLEGLGPRDWHEATISCEKGIRTGPLAVGRTTRLGEIPSVARILDRSIPALA